MAPATPRRASWGLSHEKIQALLAEATSPEDEAPWPDTEPGWPESPLPEDERQAAWSTAQIPGPATGRGMPSDPGSHASRPSADGERPDGPSPGGRAAGAQRPTWTAPTTEARPQAAESAPRARARAPRKSRDFTASRPIYPRSGVQPEPRTGWSAKGGGGAPASETHGRGPVYPSSATRRAESGGRSSSPAARQAAEKVEPSQRPWIEAVADRLGGDAARQLAEALTPPQPRSQPAPTRVFGGPVVPRDAPAARIRQSLMDEALRQIVGRSPAGNALLKDVREEIRRLDRLDTARALR